MAKLKLRHPHSLPRDAAREKVTRIFEKYKDKFGINSRWEGDDLVLYGKGFDGKAKVGQSEIQVDANLGLATSLIKGKIESVIREELEQEFKA